MLSIFGLMSLLNYVGSLLYNVCYSMARTENTQESVGSENVLTKTPMVHEDSNENTEPELTEGAIAAVFIFRGKIL